MPVNADAVCEATTSTGTGPLTLAGAYTSYFTFADSFSVGQSGIPYTIEAIDDATGVPTGDREIGYGTLTDATTFTRNTVVRSTNSNAKVNFGTGAKRVFNGPIAEFSNTVDTSLVSLVWGTPGAESANAIEIPATLIDFAGLPLESNQVDVQLVVTDGAADNEPSSTATLSAAGSPVGTVLAGSGTATLVMRTDAVGELAVKVSETAAGFRYLWVKNGGQARLWVRSSTGVLELTFA